MILDLICADHASSHICQMTKYLDSESELQRIEVETPSFALDPASSFKLKDFLVRYTFNDNK